MKKLFTTFLMFIFFFSTTSSILAAQSNGQSRPPKSLIIYYSLSGNTQTVANTLHKLAGGEIEEITTVNPYPAEFEAVVEQAREERRVSFLPPIHKLKINPQDYDVIYLGFPIWGNTLPQPMASFLSENSLAGKTIIPFCTHDGYGVGNAFRAIQQYCPKADLRPGFDILGSDTRNAKILLVAWLDRLGIHHSETVGSSLKEISLTIKAGDINISSWLYLNETGIAFQRLLPATVHMMKYGGREYYGILPSGISTHQEGKLNFEDGDLTYCPQNNSVAIFFAQTDNPDLTMKVIPIGKIKDNLSIFQNLPPSLEMTFEKVE